MSISQHSNTKSIQKLTQNQTKLHITVFFFTFAEVDLDHDALFHDTKHLQFDKIQVDIDNDDY